MRVNLIVFAFILLLAIGAPATAQQQVAVISSVKNDVNGSLTGNLTSGTKIKQNETISTNANSSVNIMFADKSSVTVGPNSNVKIDNFVYQPNRGISGVAAEVTKGAFRYISGNQPNETTRIKTPLATVGVRGTVIEGYVDTDIPMEVFIFVEGVAMEVCRDGGNCISVNQRGQYVVVTLAGANGPTYWTGPILIPDVSTDLISIFNLIITQNGGDVLPNWRTNNSAIQSRITGQRPPPPPPYY